MTYCKLYNKPSLPFVPFQSTLIVGKALILIVYFRHNIPFATFEPSRVIEDGRSCRK